MSKLVEKNYTIENFAKMISAKFPVLRKGISKHANWVYGQANLLAEFANDSIRTGDMSTVKQIFELVEQVYPKADADLVNAFECDFFEVLNLRGEIGVSVFFALSPKIQGAYKDVQEYIGAPYDPSQKK